MWAEKNLAHVMQLGDGRGVRRCTKLGQSGHFFVRFFAGQTDPLLILQYMTSDWLSESYRGDIHVKDHM